MTKVTAETITDDQLRYLLEWGEIDLVQFHQAADETIGYVDVKFQTRRATARARCAEILNATRNWTSQ